MKKIILLLIILFSLSMIYSYDFELYADSGRTKSLSCELKYDNISKTLSFDKENKIKTIKKEINSYMSLSCNRPLNKINFKLFDDNRDLIYTENLLRKKSYSYIIDIKNIELDFIQDNTCKIRTGSHTKEYNLKQNSDLDLEFVNIFSISCNSSLEGSTLRLHDKDNYNIKYKVFEGDEKSFTIDLSKTIVNYKNKVELYLIPYNSKDNFKCKTSNNEKTIEFTNSKKKLLLSKIFYTTNNFKLDCDYKFKKIQVFILDSYFNKDLNELEFNNISNLNIALDMKQTKSIQKKETKQTIKKPISKINKVTPINKTPKKLIKSNKGFLKNYTTNLTQEEKQQPIKYEKEESFFSSLWNWVFS